MTYLHYCNTNYDCKPPLDVNPLILQRFPKGKILVLCARESMVIRINNQLDKPLYNKYPDISIAPIGWWEFQEFGLLDKAGHLVRAAFLEQDAVVIVGKSRIDPMFHGLLQAVEDIFCARLTPAV